MKQSSTNYKDFTKKEECFHPVVNIDTGDYASTIRKNLKGFFKIPLTHCKTCGALVPELKIEHNHRTYAFCCYAVNEYEDVPKEKLPKDYPKDWTMRSDTKLVIGTDYKKFRNYLNRRG